MALLDALFENQTIQVPWERSRIAVDLGFGDAPDTTVKWHKALRSVCDEAQTRGVESEPQRVATAEERAKHSEAESNSSFDGISFAVGGFDAFGENVSDVSVIRCMNVLRGYGPDEQIEAKMRMMRQLTEGGLLVEGTTDTEGTLLAAHLYQREEDRVRYAGLILSTDFSRGFSPWLFRDVLPRDLRRNAVAGEPIHDFLAAWDEIVSALRSEIPEPGSLFSASLKQLALHRSDIGSWANFEEGLAVFSPRKLSERSEVLLDGTPLLVENEPRTET